MRRSIDALHAVQDDADRFFDRVLGDFDGLAQRLLSREQQWDLSRQAEEEGLSLRRQRLEEELAMAAERSAASAVACPPAVARETADADPEALWSTLAPRFEELLDEARRDRGAMDGLLASAETQTQSIAAALAELTEVRRALAEVRTAPVPDALEAAPPIDDAAEQLREELEAAQSQREALEDERSLLENELELLRARSAELTEQLAAQKRETAEQQRHWSDELKAMRGVLQGLSVQIAGSLDRAAPASAAPPPVAALVGGGAGPVSKEPLATLNKEQSGADPVLDSVMAQFQMLQKDLARRRSVQVKKVES